MPGAQPVARAPYRLAPSEMQELSGHLQELADRGYHQTESKGREDRFPKIALRTRSGHYEFHWSSMIFSFDDILIYSHNKEEHENHLRIILELLKNEKLYSKFSKCDFWISTVQFLGHVIDSRGIHVDPAKIEEIKDWASLETDIREKDETSSQKRQNRALNGRA
ncbi:reverse transcriptase domain-containing protein [Tanacetum coccineum]